MAQGRVYVYLQTNKKYNYPKVAGLLYNTNEKRFSFLSPINEEGQAIGETFGKAISEFNLKNPGVQILKVEIKKIGSSTAVITPVPTIQQPTITQIFETPIEPKKNESVLPPTNDVSENKTYIYIGLIAVVSFLLLGNKKRKK